MKKTRIAIAADHRGVELKTQLIKVLHSQNITIIDFGIGSAEERVDYPLFSKKVTEAILDKSADYGILICNTGIGMSIAANRVKGIRAALCHRQEYARTAKQHNDANIIIFGAGYIKAKDAIECLDVFLNTQFEGGRHLDRIKLLDD